MHAGKAPHPSTYSGFLLMAISISNWSVIMISMVQEVVCPSVCFTFSAAALDGTLALSANEPTTVRFVASWLKINHLLILIDYIFKLFSNADSLQALEFKSLLDLYFDRVPAKGESLVSNKVARTLHDKVVGFLFQVYFKQSFIFRTFKQFLPIVRLNII